MKKTNNNDGEPDFPQAAIDAWAAVFIDVADKLDQDLASNATLRSLPTQEKKGKGLVSDPEEF